MLITHFCRFIMTGLPISMPSSYASGMACVRSAGSARHRRRVECLVRRAKRRISWGVTGSHIHWASLGFTGSHSLGVVRQSRDAQRYWDAQCVHTAVTEPWCTHRPASVQRDVVINLSFQFQFSVAGSAFKLSSQFPGPEFRFRTICQVQVLISRFQVQFAGSGFSFQVQVPVAMFRFQV